MNSHRTYLDLSNSRKTIIRTFLLQNNLSTFYFPMYLFVFRYKENITLYYTFVVHNYREFVW